MTAMTQTLIRASAAMASGPSRIRRALRVPGRSVGRRRCGFPGVVVSGDEHALTVHFFRLAVFLRRAPSAGSVLVGITGMLVRCPGVVVLAC